MKRVLSVFLSVALCFSAFYLVSNLFHSVLTISNEKKILNEDLPTEQQIRDFELKTKEKNYFYYNNLSSEAKEIYITLYYCFFDFDDKIVLDTVNKNELNDVFIAVLYDNPDVFWIDLKYEYTIYESYTELFPRYRLSSSEVDSMNREIGSKIDDVMRKVNSLKSDYEKELFIHDYVAEITQYDIETMDNLGDTVYSCLVSGRSICEGYARTTQILLDKAGISNYLVVGNGETDSKIEPHMWNVVEIDGKNYHLDVTWDDLSLDDKVAHFYFNVTDSFIARDHMDIEPQNNQCNSIDANYFFVQDAFISSFNGYSQHTARTANVLEDGENMVEFFFADKDDYDTALNYLKNDNGFFNYIASAIKMSGRKLNSTSVDYYVIEEFNYLCVVFKEG